MAYQMVILQGELRDLEDTVNGWLAANDPTSVVGMDIIGSLTRAYCVLIFEP